MKNSELRGLSIDELNDRITTSAKNLQTMKFAHAVSPIENPMQIQSLRRHVASMKTVLTEQITGEIKAKIADGSVDNSNIDSFLKEAKYPVALTSSKIKKLFAQAK